MSFAQWVSIIPGILLGTGIEIPYANAHGSEVNQQTAHLFGKDLGMALAMYL
jgi:hypothetical protein